MSDYEDDMKQVRSLCESHELKQILRIFKCNDGMDGDTAYFLDFGQMGSLTKDEFVHILRRQSTGFSRGSSRFRGVTLHKCGRWEARMGQFLGKK